MRDVLCFCSSKRVKQFLCEDFDFFSFTNKIHTGAWESVCCGYRTTDVFRTGWLADNILVLKKQAVGGQEDKLGITPKPKTKT